MEGESSINVSKVNPSAADTPTEDQPQDTSRKGYFLEKDLHSTTKMKMHFRKTTNEATFLPRQVADSIPFSSNKFLEILNRQEYELGVGVKVVADKSVVCHKQKYQYAVFYCHAIHKTRVYTLPFVGTEDGTKTEVVASCHIDTSAWNPKHAVFQVLKVKPGTVPVCHFLPRDDLI
ncbi:hypothetical protein PVL29_004221 [Vitis rotundifolia]|uniref:BURP domain-containing protein n=1 Tax=Vitis rotundifolia TaxID=103349 RepID=A0AA39E054_VITRO|nr:hypothetical protein PVL29_004221 [Vitis rotundifolia]